MNKINSFFESVLISQKNMIIILLLFTPFGLSAQSALIKDIEVMFTHNLERMHDYMINSMKFKLQDEHEIEEIEGYELIIYWNEESNNNFQSIYVAFKEDYSSIEQIWFESRNNKFYNAVKSDLIDDGYKTSVVGNKEFIRTPVCFYIFETHVSKNHFFYRILVKLL